jgi:hypothetical protein
MTRVSFCLLIPTFVLLFIFYSQRVLAVCPDGFTEDATLPQPVCIPIPGYVKTYLPPGAPCETSSECDTPKNFHCIGKICTCDPETSILQERIVAKRSGVTQGSFCSIKVGSSCSSPEQTFLCVQGAFCNATAGNVCTCNYPATETSTRMCGRPYSSLCSDNEVCADGLSCRAQSPYAFPLIPFPLPPPMPHVGYPGQEPLVNPHNGGGRHHVMVKRMVESSSMTRGVAGTISVGVGSPQAVRNQGSGYARQGPPRNSFTISGAYFPGTSARSVCQCSPKYQMYDQQTRSCRVLVGAPCDPSKNDINVTTSGGHCVERAVCTQKETAALCECQDGFVETVEGQCDLAYGQECKMNQRPSYGQAFEPMCDTAAQLVCSSGKCSCPSEEDVFDAERRQCVTKAGIRCHMDEECQTGMSCVRKSTKIWGRCGPKPT